MTPAGHLDFHEVCNPLFIWIHLRVTISIFAFNPTHLKPKAFATCSTQPNISLLDGNIVLPAKRYLLQRGKVVFMKVEPIKQSALTKNLS